MRLELTLAQKQRSVLVDTGAARSLMKKAVWLDICQYSHRAPVVQTAEVLKSLSGHVLPTLGRTNIELQGKVVPFYIVDKLRTDVLLGGDALDILEANIDFKTHSVKLGGRSIKAQHAKVLDKELAAIHTEGDSWVARFPEVFNTSTGLKATDLVEMEIDTGDAHPINQRPYRLPLRKRQIVDEEIDKMLSEGIIERSASPWASPITLVPKKDGSIRFCVDYRKLNSVTKKDSYPLPNIQDIFDTMTGSSVFTTLDLKSGYWQVPMSEDAKEKTGFVCHRGLFHFKRMPFGLSNAPATFQRLMNHVLASYIGKSVMVYLDDIVIFSRSQEEHDRHVAEVFETLQQAGLTVKLSKCEFSQPEVKLLGYIVSGQGIRSDPEKARAISEMAPPTDVKGVRSFLGMTGYYRQCIPNYAEVANPLVKLTHKYVRFVWGPREQQAWETLRDLLVSDYVMAYPQLDKPYKLYTDACDYAVGAILCQDDAQGVERPVQYISKQLSGAALKWPTVVKEAYAVIFALNKLRPYLFSSKFTIYTDHKPLKSLFLSEVKNTKIQRWAVLLAEYGAPIEYRQGPHNIRADMLSRIRPRDDIDRQGLTISAVIEEEEIPWDFDELEKEQVVREQRLMPEYRLGRETEEEYAITDGLLYTLLPPPGRAEYPRLVLPPTARFRVIRRAHAEVGHQGMRKTLDRVQEAYKWPGMRADIYKCLSKCAKCAVHRTKREHVMPTSMPIAQYPSQILGMDMCGPFPESRHGNRYVLTVIDHCTGWVEVKPLRNKTAENVVHYLSSEYIPRYGPPEIVITDQGLEFKNKDVLGYLESLGTEVRHSSPFHPQTNGKIERFHRTFKGIIRTFINGRPNEWEDHLGPTLWAHRVSTSTVTGYTPYFLTFGRRARVPFGKIYRIPEGYEGNILGTRLQELANAFRSAAINTENSRRYNHKRLQERANAKELKIGDSVVILASGASPLDPKWDHGYIVVNLRGSVVTAEGPGNKRRIVNRDKVRLVNPEADWDTLRNRETRTQRVKKRQLYAREGFQIPTHAPLVIQQVPDRRGGRGDPGGSFEVLSGAGPQRRNWRERRARGQADSISNKRPLPDSDRESTTSNHKAPRASTYGVITRARAQQNARDTAVKRSLHSDRVPSKKSRFYRPTPPTKRSASQLSPEESQAEKKRCIEFVMAFFASLP